MSSRAVSVKVNVTKEAFEAALMEAVNIQDLIDYVRNLSELVERKNKDYGDAWQRYGLFTPLIRINDKLLRLANLSDGKQALVADETISDTLDDIIGYAVLAKMWLMNNPTGSLEDLDHGKEADEESK